MKSGLKWMVLAVAVLVSTSAWAVWDPNADPALIFYMNFEVYDNGAHTTTSAIPAPPNAIVGTLEDYNTVYPNVFGETSAPGLGFDANFAVMHDNAPGPGVATDTPSPNDVRVTVPSGTGVFDLSSFSGYLVDKHTWTFWFNVPDLTQGTIIRYAYNDLTDPSYQNKLWEIRIFGGVLEFYHKDNCLKMQTASTLSALGLTVNTWHHAAVVIDRSNSMETGAPTTQLSTKIYVDGLEVPVIVTSLNTSSMNVDPFYNSPLWIGAGERVFNGLLDDVRLYSRVLTPVEVSILNQPDKTQPIALLPIPRSSNVIMTTDVNWVPAPGATAQKVYFGTDPCNLVLKKTATDGTTHIATNAEIGGPLSLNTTYYWYVRSTIGGIDSNGPLWSFNSETGKAINTSPIDGAEDIDPCDANLIWFTPSAATYTVYASATMSLVESNDVNAQIATGISEPCVMGYDPNSRGAIIYWRVNSTYASVGTIAGDIWSFRTKPYELVFNTSGSATTYSDQVIPAYTCELHGNGWSDPCAIGSPATDGVVVFDFNGFNYDKRYDIIVVPQVRPEWIDVNTPAPLAIHVTGNFYFDGRVQIAGDDITTTTQDVTYARSGGFPGPKHNQDTSRFAADGEFPGGIDPCLANYWTTYTFPQNYHTHYGIYTSSSDHYIYVPTALAQSTFGPGVPVDPPYKGGGGGGSGGVGGEAGRGYQFGVFSGGPSYGDKEVPVPFGGSAGGWGGTNSPGGAAGGGGIEIVATGNVVLDVNSQINANGGGQLSAGTQYPAGGGGGGSVKIIAGGSVTNNGTIDVSGGDGGDSSKGTNDNGGGGGGGRVAIFYGTTYSNTGIITADGGAKGTYPGTPQTTLAQDGQDGTIYVVNSSTVSPKKASAPTPANGNTTVYCTDPCTNFQLSWYSGYGGTTDVVYCDTNSNPTTSRGSVSAARGQHSVTMTVSSGNTYYMKVITDGNVSSDIWSFKTVSWMCRQYDGNYPHVGGPEWDSNRDCVLDIEDLDYFAANWLNPAFGTTYALEFSDFARLASEWHECFNRTDGCAGF